MSAPVWSEAVWDEQVSNLSFLIIERNWTVHLTDGESIIMFTWNWNNEYCLKKKGKKEEKKEK